MAGYKWDVRIRMTPDNGPEDNFRANTDFLTTGGNPTTVLTRVRLVYKAEQKEREDFARTKNTLPFGFSATVVLEFTILNMTHYRLINKLARRLHNRTWRCELALDGKTYRDAILKKAPSPVPLKKKTVSGATFAMEVVTQQTFDDPLPIEGGTGW